MKILIVEDDFISRKLLHNFLSALGDIDVAISGQEAVDAVGMAIDGNQPYALICMDIMMPGVDGLQALRKIRQMEAQHGFTPENRARVIMTSALSNKESVVAAARASCDGYIIKPITRSRLLDELGKFGIDSTPQ